MENMLLLLATILCGSSAILSLFSVSKRIKKFAVVLWCLSVLFIVITNGLLAQKGNIKKYFEKWEVHPIYSFF